MADGSILAIACGRVLPISMNRPVGPRNVRPLEAPCTMSSLSGCVESFGAGTLESRAALRMRLKIYYQHESGLFVVSMSYPPGFISFSRHHSYAS